MKTTSINNNLPSKHDKKYQKLISSVEEFIDKYQPLENQIYLLMDNKTEAVFCECHILASKLMEDSTIDVPLDPEEQPEYRANRVINDKSPLYIQMINDAANKRAFSNIIAEFTKEFDHNHPLKIIGGQHRYTAIKNALEKDINEYHGVKVYFGLDLDQRMDVQIISNTNIDISPDLLDRVWETNAGPELRNWCYQVGLLNKDTLEDFADKRQQGSPVTVRTARTFIMNFYEGEKILPDKWDSVETTPVIASTGGTDEDWNKLRQSKPEMWNDENLIEAGKEFALLVKAQQDFFNEDGNVDRINLSYSSVAYNYSVVSSWAFVSGVLQNNKTRLQRHYSLKNNNKNTDPLNAGALAEGRHKNDPEKYRGIATRYGKKELGRMAELFYAQAENGNGIKKGLIDIAISQYHAKLAYLDLEEKKAKYQQ